MKLVNIASALFMMSSQIAFRVHSPYTVNFTWSLSKITKKIIFNKQILRSIASVINVLKIPNC
jgi:hypothetical protein